MQPREGSRAAGAFSLPSPYPSICAGAVPSLLIHHPELLRSWEGAQPSSLHSPALIPRQPHARGSLRLPSIPPALGCGCSSLGVSRGSNCAQLGQGIRAGGIVHPVLGGRGEPLLQVLWGWLGRPSHSVPVPQPHAIVRGPGTIWAHSHKQPPPPAAPGASVCFAAPLAPIQAFGARPLEGARVGKTWGKGSFPLSLYASCLVPKRVPCSARASHLPRPPEPLSPLSAPAFLSPFSLLTFAGAPRCKRASDWRRMEGALSLKGWRKLIKLGPNN